MNADKFTRRPKNRVFAITQVGITLVGILVVGFLHKNNSKSGLYLHLFYPLGASEGIITTIKEVKGQTTAWLGDNRLGYSMMRWAGPG